MSNLKMEALRTFAGVEGFFHKGDQFFALSERRAVGLEARKLAKRLEDQSPPKEPEQTVPPPQDDDSPQGQVRLIEPVTEPEIVDRPPFKEAVKHVGGGWYELPNGERINGKEAAQAVYERGEFDG